MKTSSSCLLPTLHPELTKPILAWHIGMRGLLAMLAYRIAPSPIACFAGFTAAVALGFTVEWNKKSLFKRWLALKTPGTRSDAPLARRIKEIFIKSKIDFLDLSPSEAINQEALTIKHKQQAKRLSGYLLSRTFSILLRGALPLALAALFKNHSAARAFFKCYQSYTMAAIGLSVGSALAARRIRQF